MIARQEQCRVCGRPVPEDRLAYCGEGCYADRLRQRDHAHYWRTTHPGEPVPPLEAWRQGTCRVCGKPLPRTRQVLCANPKCQARDRQRVQREYHERTRCRTGTYTPRPRPEACAICGKPMPQDGPWRMHHAGYCKKIADSQRMSRYYFAHRETVLARQRDYQAAKRRAARG